MTSASVEIDAELLKNIMAKIWEIGEASGLDPQEFSAILTVVAQNLADYTGVIYDSIKAVKADENTH